MYSDGQDDYPHIRQSAEKPATFYGTRLPLVLVEHAEEELFYDDIEFEDTMKWGHRTQKGEYWPDAMGVSFDTVDSD